jgi:hypothetical protein
MKRVWLFPVTLLFIFSIFKFTKYVPYGYVVLSIVKLVISCGGLVGTTLVMGEVTEVNVVETVYPSCPEAGVAVMDVLIGPGQTTVSAVVPKTMVFDWVQVEL